MVTDEMVEKAMLSLYGSDFYDNWDRNTSFVVNREVGMRAALEAALCAAEPVEQEDYKALFEECQLARDETGFLGSVPDCIRYLDAEAKATPPALSVAVKPLEWRIIENGQLMARTDLAIYIVDADPGCGSPAWYPCDKDEDWHPEETIEAAKVAAQADYEARIRSALSAQVQDVAGSPLREVFERWRDGYGFNEDSDEDVALLERAATPAKQEGGTNE